MHTPETARLLLLLAACAQPVALDALVETQLWKPSRLLAAIDQGRAQQLLSFDPAQERLAWIGDPSSLVTSAAPADLDALLEAPFCLDLLLQGARLAASARRFAAAEVLFRALAQVRPPLRATFPGGQATWVATVLQATRLFRSAWTVAPVALEAAISFAEAHGDLASQAVLLAARGVQALSEDLDQARRCFDQAAEATETLETPTIRAEVHTYIAVSLILSGRPGQGIAAFEALLGDVQTDLLEPSSGMLLDLEGAAPASALSLLANAYATLGDHPRAVDLMQRVLDRGLELNSPALQAQGRVMLALAFMLAGDRRAAGTHADAAHAWFVHITSPYSWACALARAWSRALERPQEARDILQQALPVWQRTGRYWIGGSRALELLETLDQAGVPPLEDLTVAGEVTRFLDAPQPLLAGIAQRWAARRAPTSPLARAHLDQARRLLREAGGGIELHWALEDSVKQALQAGDTVTAGLLQAEKEGRFTPSSGTDDILRQVNAILELGRLGPLSPPRGGHWGEVAARLCRELGAERCLLLLWKDSRQAEVLAARGTPAWCEAVLDRVKRDLPHGPSFAAALTPAPSGRPGQLVLVPFEASDARRGMLALENRDTAPRVGPGDAALLATLGRQLGILLDNVALWRELLEMRQRLEQENRYHRETGAAAPLGSGRMVGHSTAMRQVLELVRRAGPGTTPVLVSGETGVGKELVSREVHLASARRAGPFIAVNVAALSPGLVASALFGHERGAFTGATEQTKGRFELAHGGTLFLDEVGELSPEDQVRLLRVLQEGTFERVGGSRPLRSDFRLVAATNRDLATEVRSGRFREDLYFRLAAFPIRVPPLRERQEEIPVLALFFMERVARKLGLAFEGISEEDMEGLCRYAWPGNVRELEHVIERAALLSDPPRLRIPPLEGSSLRLSAPPPDAPSPGRPAPLDEWESLEEHERRYIRRVLIHVQGRVSGPNGAAALLELKPTTLQFWIDRLGLREDLAQARKRKGKPSSS